MALTRKKTYVLDTNVLMHDPAAFLKFENNDVVVPLVVLEELDKHKVGQNDINRNARAATRLLEKITQQPGSFTKGFKLKGLQSGEATGNLFILSPSVSAVAESHLDQSKADNQILATVITVRELIASRAPILVSKDINLRVKARSAGYDAQDYLHDHAIDDADLLYRGYREINFSQLEEMLHRPDSSWQIGGVAHYELSHPKVEPFKVNEFISLESGTMLRAISTGDKSAVFRQILPRFSDKAKVCGVSALNNEQNFALELLLDPEIDFVTLLGPAGTGKTLLTLAAALAQTALSDKYSEVLFTRATVPMGEEIGFLPGTEEEKIGAWMGALDDNLEVIGELSRGGKRGGFDFNDIESLREIVKIKAMTFMRGRTFQRKFLIIDEAQNLTPKQIKALVTRAGQGTKVVCMGNLGQIDTPYLSETSSGLTYAVESFKGWKHFGHLILTKGERSRLANYANDNF